MELYDFVKFGHVVAAAVWLGAAVTVQVLAGMARRAGPDRTTGFVADASRLSKGLFMPASILAIGLGIWLVTMRWTFSETWITLGLVGFALSTITGSAILGPTSEKLAAVVADRGVDDPEAQRLLGRWFGVGRIDLVVLLAVFFVMITKPGS